MPYLIPRRSLIASAAVGLARCALHVPVGSLLADDGETAPAPIIDCHTHFYDPTRPEGVPWPSKDDKLLYRPVLPADFIAIARPLSVTGTVVVEASPRVEDNQWVLDRAAEEPFIVGLVGNLAPGF